MIYRVKIINLKDPQLVLHKCHSLQFSKIHRDKTKAHHNAINKRRTRI